MSVSESIRIVMIKRNINITTLAKRYGISGTAMSNKLKQNNWKESELETIADILNCKLNLSLTLNDSGETF